MTKNNSINKTIHGALDDNLINCIVGQFTLTLKLTGHNRNWWMDIC